MVTRYNVLFLFTGNSARFIMAEAIMNKKGFPNFRAYEVNQAWAGEEGQGATAQGTERLPAKKRGDSESLQSQSARLEGHSSSLAPLRRPVGLKPQNSRPQTGNQVDLDRSKADPKEKCSRSPPDSKLWYSYCKEEE